MQNAPVGMHIAHGKGQGRRQNPGLGLMDITRIRPAV